MALRQVTYQGKTYKFPADATDAEVAEQLEIVDSMRVSPQDQLQRDRVSYEVKGAELAENPENTALQRDVELTRRSVERQAAAIPAAPGPSALGAGDLTVPTPGEKQTRAEEDFNRAMKEWRARTGGRLAPGQTERQAVTAATGIQDPRETSEMADLGELAAGRLTPSDSVGYTLGKGLAQTAGFATGGPGGAIGAGGLADVAVLATRLNQGVQAGAIDQDQAAEIMAVELVKRVGVDAVLTLGLPLLARVPGVRWLGDKVGKLAAKAAAGQAKTLPGGQLVPKGALSDVATGVEHMDAAAALQAASEAAKRASMERPGRRLLAPGTEARYAKLAASTDDDATRVALGEFQRRGTATPTPGQVTGFGTAQEAAARKIGPVPFEQARQTQEAATEAARQELVRTGQTAEQFGDEILSIAGATEKAAKARLGQVFDKVNEAGVGPNVAAMVGAVDDALVRSRALSPGEVSELKRLRATLVEGMPEGQAFLTPQELRDTLSALKATQRAVNPDGKPSPLYAKMVGDVTRAGEDALEQALRKAGKSDLAVANKAASAEYRELMETVFDKTLVTAARRDPEAVGKLLWGSSSHVDDMNKVLALAVKEGKLSAAQMQEVRGKMAKGFVEDTARDGAKLAQWSQTLQSDRAKRETWDALTRGPGGAELREAMKSLEAMAQIAKRGAPVEGGRGPIPLEHAMGRAASAITGTNQAGFTVYALTLTQWARLLPALYTSGEKGLLNQVFIALGPKTAGTAAGFAAANRVAEWARANGIYDQKDEE